MVKRNLCVFGVPLPPYIKEGGREAGPLGVCQEYGVLVRIPFLFRVGEKERGKERGSRKGQGGRRPLPLVQFGPMGGRHLPLAYPFFSRMAQ